MLSRPLILFITLVLAGFGPRKCMRRARCCFLGGDRSGKRTPRQEELIQRLGLEKKAN